MKIFQNKWVKWGLILILVAGAGYYLYETNRRAKERTNWINWMKSLPDSDQWKSQIIAKATANNRTIDEQLEMDANWLHPANIFKPEPK